MSNLHELDDKIIRLLERDAWQSSARLAKQLHVSSSTVRRRLTRLKKDGVVRAVAIPDASKTGVTITAMLALNVQIQGAKAVLKEVASLRQVIWAAMTTGRFDIVALARFHSSSELSEFLQGELANIKGIRESETFIYLQVERGPHILSPL